MFLSLLFNIGSVLGLPSMCRPFPTTNAGSDGRRIPFGAGSPTSQIVTEIRPRLLRQVSEQPAFDAGEDIAINQIAVPALGFVIPVVPVACEPLAAPFPGHQRFFFYILLPPFGKRIISQEAGNICPKNENY